MKQFTFCPVPIRTAYNLFLRSRRIGQLENQFVLTILQKRPFHLCLTSKMISWANVLYCFFSIEQYICSKQNINSQDPLSSFVLNAVFNTVSNTVSLLSLYHYMFKAGYQLSGPPFFSCSRPWPSPSPGRPTS